MSNEFIAGVFVEECRKRFLCKVEIQGQEELCYISSSSKLAPFIELVGREVLLTKNIGDRNKTNYTVHAVKTCEGYVLLNLSFVNKLLLIEFNKPESIYSGLNTIYREKKIINSLRADFVIEGKQKIIVEAKGIITEKITGYLPSMTVIRAVKQLEAFNQLLREGYCVHYYVVLMNPGTRDLKLNKEILEFHRLFKRCMKKGMQVFVYRVKWDNEFCSIIRDKLVEMSFLKEIYCIKRKRQLVDVIDVYPYKTEIKIVGK